MATTQKKWGDYFKVKSLQKTGEVHHPKTVIVDLSNTNLPVQQVKALYDTGCPYLELSPEGQKELYPVKQEEEK